MELVAVGCSIVTVGTFAHHNDEDYLVLSVVHVRLR